MALDPTLVYAIEAKYKLGKTPKDAASELGMNIKTIYAQYAKLRKNADNELVEEVSKISAPILTEMIEQVKDNNSLPPTAVKDMEVAVVAIDGLKKLDQNFQTTMTNVLNRFNHLLTDTDIALKDIVQISSSVSSAYEKIFSSGTNIHIGDNNQHSTQQLTVFKSKQGV